MSHLERDLKHIEDQSKEVLNTFWRLYEHIPIPRMDKGMAALSGVTKDIWPPGDTTEDTVKRIENTLFATKTYMEQTICAIRGIK